MIVLLHPHFLRTHRRENNTNSLAYLNECLHKSLLHKRNLELWSYLKVWYCTVSISNASNTGFGLRKCKLTVPSRDTWLFVNSPQRVSEVHLSSSESRIESDKFYMFRDRFFPCHATVVETVN